jgi:hypothetical protein
MVLGREVKCNNCVRSKPEESLDEIYRGGFLAEKEADSMLKKFFVAGVVFLFACTFSITGYCQGSIKELCASSAKEFQKINQLKGFMPDQLNDADYKTIQQAAEIIVNNEGTRQGKFNLDANTKNISKLVQVHAGRIAERCKADREGCIEDTGHHFRFLFLSCRSCHQIYVTEAGVAP